MRLLRFVLALLAVVALHLIGVNTFDRFSQYVDVFVVLIVLNALDASPAAGLLGGMAAGLCEDAVTGSAYGLHGIAGTLIGYGTALAARQVVVQNPLVVGLFFVLAAALQEGVVTGLLLLMTLEPPIPQPVWLVVKSVNCGALGLLLWLGRRRLGARLAQRARSKVRKVKL